MKVLFLVLLSLLPVSALLAAPDLNGFRADSLQVINAFRQAQGQKPVRLDDSLNGISLEWAQHLAGDGKIYHRSRESLDGFLQKDHWHTMNENLFIASQPVPAAAVVEAWEKSPGHRRNLLQSDIDRIGISIAQTANGGMVAVFNGAGVDTTSSPTGTQYFR